MELEVEVWKDVPNYEGLYQVSSFGRVKSFLFGKEKILKDTAGNNGYPLVNLYKDFKVTCFNVHILVAIAFLGHKPDGTRKVIVDHRDNNKLNNRVDNLKLVNYRENNSKDKKNKTSQYTGVRWRERNKKWEACIKFRDRSIHLGCFELEIDASNAYQKALSEWEQGLDLDVLYPKRTKSSRYEGVYWHKKTKKWTASYMRKHIGSFDTEIEAYEARQKYILQLQENVIILS